VAILEPGESAAVTAKAAVESPHPKY